MSGRRNTELEVEEANRFQEIVDKNGAYLGGVFEAGGWMNAYLLTKVQKGRPNTYGFLGMSISDNREKTLMAFQSLLGGKTYRDGDAESWFLKVTRRIPAIASAISLYAPSRREFTALAMMWEEMSVEERREAVKEFKRDRLPGGRDPIRVEQYTTLVKTPEFLAGVLDARGRFFTIHRIGLREGTLEPWIRVVTHNNILLHAMKKEYGGVIDERVTGREGKKGITVHWSISHRKANALYEIVKPFILVKEIEAGITFSRYRS